MKLQIYQVDAFSGEPFGGNPAAVCLLPPSVLGGMTDQLRQSIAAEMNLSETAFLEPLDPATAAPDTFSTADSFNLRWFTPAAEVPLCGHATLASAATLFSECGNPSDTLHFHTLSGVLSVTRTQAQGRSMLQMSLPLSPAIDPLPAPLQDNSGLERLLRCLLPGLQPAEVVEHVGYVASLKYLLVVLKRGMGRARLAALRPDIAGMEAAVTAQHMTGVILAAHSEPDEPGAYAFYSRFFGPWAGIAEDPVTGSAHAVLGPHFARLLDKPAGQLLARQVSARGGDVLVDMAAPAGRLLVSGEAAVVMAGELRLP